MLICSFKRPIFSSGSFVVCVWRQRSSDQDDHKGKKPDNETYFQNPQELLLIGYLIESIWPKNQNQIHGHQKPTCWHTDQGNFTRDEWNHLLCLVNISHFSSTNCSEVMSKERKKIQVKRESQQNRNRWWICLVSRCSERTPVVPSSTASESQGKTRHESQTPSESAKWEVR